jgi:hypothetical protein
MILVAGLAVAGLAGIAAAFYFSMHPGVSRVRAAGPGRAGDNRRPASKGRASRPSADRSDRSDRPARSARDAGEARSARPARPARSAPDGRSGSRRPVDRTGSSTVIDFTGPQRVLDDSEPVVTDRRARHGDHLDDTPDEPRPSRRSAAWRVHEAAADDAAQASRSRRRVAWRKGSDVDEELWPAESFGGVSDEQFWDDLAADKPLATTARAAQTDTAARRRPPGSGPLPDLYPADDRGRGDGRRGAAEGQGTYPRPRLSPDDRAAIQPVQAGTQPSPTPTTATQPVPTATQPVRAARQLAETRGRSRSGTSADEDPLTSPAYSLRPKRSVNGQSYPSSRRSQDLTGEQYHTANGRRGRPDVSRPDVSRSEARRPEVSRSEASRPEVSRSEASRPDVSRSDASRPDMRRPDGYRSEPLGSDPPRSGSAYGGAVRTDYPYPQQPYSQPAQAMSASLRGERYGYGNPDGSWSQSSAGRDPRQANGGWSPGRAGGNGAGGTRGLRVAYPSANGYRAPYDPRGYDRRS